MGKNVGRGSYRVLGLSIPKAIAWLILATVGGTALSAVFERNHIFPLQTYMVLAPDWVLRGEIWRLLTWSLLETGWDGLALIFGCMLLYSVGGDLLGRWGTGRFFAVYFGTAAAAGGMTCLIARFFWPALLKMPYFTMWPAVDALIIAWAVYNPDARIFMQFVFPVSGRNIIYAMIGFRVIASMIDGLPHYVPHFCAQAFILVYMDVISVRRIYLRGRMAMLQRDYRRRTAHLRMVDRDEEKPPRWMH